MKKIVKINEISKEELYDLYIKKVAEYEALEARFFAQELELADKIKKLEEANFQLVQRNKFIFGKKREINKASKNDFNEAENQSETKKPEIRKRTNEKNTLTRDFLEGHYSEEVVLNPEEIIII